MKKDGKQHRYVKKPYDSFLTDSLKIPADVCTGEIQMSFAGDRQALVENYQSLMEYSKDKVILQGKKLRISVEGINLRLK